MMIEDGNMTSTHAGATVHGSGVKVFAESYGCDGNCTEETVKRTVIEEACDKGYSIGIIKSGTISEPTTEAFMAHVTECDNHYK